MPHIKYHKYLLPYDYEEFLPDYKFKFRGKYLSDENIIKIKVSELLRKRENLGNVLELGIGSGIMTRIIAPKSKYFEGEDISEEMVNHTKRLVKNPNSKFIIQEMKEYIKSNNYLDRFDNIFSFWSFNYPLLSCYEEFDHKKKKIIPRKDLNLADEDAKSFIKTFFKKCKRDAKFLFLFFDAKCPEQNIVTDLWEIVAPFPNNDRNHTSSIFFQTLEDLKDHGVIKFKKTFLRGRIILDNKSEVVNTFLNLHLRGIFNHNKNLNEIINKLEKKVMKYKVGEKYIIPSGAYMVEAEKN